MYSTKYSHICRGANGVGQTKWYVKRSVSVVADWHNRTSAGDDDRESALDTNNKNNKTAIYKVQ